MSIGCQLPKLAVVVVYLAFALLSILGFAYVPATVPLVYGFGRAGRKGDEFLVVLRL